MITLLLINSGSSHDECRTATEPLSCGPNEPLISFPFQLVKESSQDLCVRPEFCLYCSQNNKTMIVLSTTTGLINFIVYRIVYEEYFISISDPENCLPNKFLKLNNSSFLPYRSLQEKLHIPRAFLPRAIFRGYYPWLVRGYKDRRDSLSTPETHKSPTTISATETFSSVPAVTSLFFPLNWNECEAKGMKCKWKNNGTKGETECFYCNKKRKLIQIPISLIYASTGSILLGLVLIALFKLHLYFREKEEDQIRVDKFLEDYKAQKPARFSYADIKRITGGFKEKLGEGAHGTVFEGKLSSEILVAVKMLNNTAGEGKEFINEVGIMGKIHHINVVRLLGFCADGIHRALVYNFFPNGSLQSFIFPPDNKDNFIGWEKLQQIGIGIAEGIEYLHQGCNNPIIHFDINPHNILLDDSFTPKISDFGLAKLCSKNLSFVSMTAAKGTLGYMAPEVLSRNFGNVSLKSDIYSYGMLLLEMVGGRNNVDMSSAEACNVLYPEWIHNLLEGDVHIHIEDEGDVKIANKLAIVGLWCIQWQPINRPSIKSVVQMLKTGEDMQLMVPPNPFRSMTSMTNNDQCTLARTTFQMEVIHE
ncbi:rust resistance kinase Lr10 [Trifolium repens]|nr:rust resistance kinase Lr10 [Trifolium repens]